MLVKRVVIKLSGSIFRPEEGAKPITTIINLLKDLHSRGVQSIVVAGGGISARRYIAVARSLGADESSLDGIGIDVAKLKAKLLVSGLGDLVHPRVPESLDDAAQAAEGGRIVVAGGFHPGQSTNAVAALLAEKTRADLFINATDVDGVYTSDPRTHKTARKLSKVKIGELTSMLLEGGMEAGGYDLMDLVALKIIARSKIKTRLVKCDAGVIEDATQGKAVGTLLVS
ncbi:MAG: UMP kinase [Thaumarchaeota archaeon]|nr:UMP kinase [Nitrososphaerota archaeon]